MEDKILSLLKDLKIQNTAIQQKLIREILLTNMKRCGHTDPFYKALLQLNKSLDKLNQKQDGLTKSAKSAELHRQKDKTQEILKELLILVKKQEAARAKKTDQPKKPVTKTPLRQKQAKPVKKEKTLEQLAKQLDKQLEYIKAKQDKALEEQKRNRELLKDIFKTSSANIRSYENQKEFNRELRQNAKQLHKKLEKITDLLIKSNELSVSNKKSLQEFIGKVSQKVIIALQKMKSVERPQRSSNDKTIQKSFKAIEKSLSKTGALAKTLKLISLDTKQIRLSFGKYIKSSMPMQKMLGKSIKQLANKPSVIVKQFETTKKLSYISAEKERTQLTLPFGPDKERASKIGTLNFNPIRSEKTPDFIDFIKIAKMGPAMARLLSPGGITKMMGLLSESPALMLLGDSITNLTGEYRDFKKDYMSREDRLSMALRSVGVKKDATGQIINELKGLNTENSDEIKKVLINYGVTNKEVVKTVLSEMAAFEDELLTNNIETVKLLREANKSDSEILNVLISANDTATIALQYSRHIASLLSQNKPAESVQIHTAATMPAIKERTQLTLPGFARGGLVNGPDGNDKVLAKLTKNEYVMPKSAVRYYGKTAMDSIKANAATVTNKESFWQEDIQNKQIALQEDSNKTLHKILKEIHEQSKPKEKDTGLLSLGAELFGLSGILLKLKNLGAFLKNIPVLGSIGLKLKNLGPIKGVFTFIERTFPVIGKIARTIGKIPGIGLLGRIGGKLFWPLTIITSIWDAVDGWFKASEITGKSEKDLTLWDKIRASISSFLSGWTFGLIDAKTINNFVEKLSSFMSEKLDFLTSIGKWIGEKIFIAVNTISDGFSSISEKLKTWWANFSFTQFSVNLYDSVIGWFSSMLADFGKKISDLSLSDLWTALKTKFSEMNYSTPNMVSNITRETYSEDTDTTTRMAGYKAEPEAVMAAKQTWLRYTKGGEGLTPGSSFGMRPHPLNVDTSGKPLMQFHSGIDLQMKEGTPIYASAPGIVTAVGTDENSPSGKFVQVKRKDGFIESFAHLQNINVEKGQEIGVNTPIGTSGKTGKTAQGKTYGEHLHWRVRKEDEQGKMFDVNPETSGLPLNTTGKMMPVAAPSKTITKMAAVKSQNSSNQAAQQTNINAPTKVVNNNTTTTPRPIIQAYDSYFKMQPILP